MNIKKVIVNLLITISLTIGILIFFWVIKDYYIVFKTTKNYETTIAYYTDYSIYSKDADDITYKLIYTYNVGGNEYHVMTNYTYDVVSEVNASKKVKYNPNNPTDSLLIKNNINLYLIFIGTMFILVPINLILILNKTKIRNYLRKLKIDIFQIFVGLTFLMVGMIFFMYVNSETLSLVNTIKLLGIFSFIPVGFVICGIAFIIKGIFVAKRKKYLTKKYY